MRRVTDTAAPDDETRRLQSALAVVRGVALLFAVLSVAGWAIAGDARILAAAAADVFVVACASIAKRRASSSPASAAGLASASLVVVALALAPVFPMFRATLAEVPIVAVVLALPYLSSAAMRRLLAAAIATVVFVVGTGYALAATAAPVGPELTFIGESGMVAATFLVLAMMIHQHERLRAALGTERAARATAEAATRARDDFLSVASHELKTPLTVLRIVVEQLGRRPDGDDAFHKKLEQLDRQTARLGRLVDQLLDVSRAAAARLQIEREEIDVGGVARAVAERLSPIAAASGGAIEVDVAGAVRGACDPLRVEQIVTNLIENALKHARGARVRVAVRADADACVLEVADDGPGIAAADHEKVFGRYERGAAAGRAEGLGLGLWITREIVRAHGGSIELDSDVGRGARFVVRLPRPADPVAPADAGGGSDAAR